MNLSTEVKESVILFHDGSKHFITKEQYLDIFFSDKTEQVILKDSGLRFSMSSVKKIFADLEEFYSEYPDQRPANREYLKFGPIEKSFGSKRAIKGILQGLRNYVSSKEYQGTSAPLDLIKHWEKRYADLE